MYLLKLIHDILEIKVTLIFAISKIALLNQNTLTRLELCVVALEAHLVEKFKLVV